MAIEKEQGREKNNRLTVASDIETFDEKPREIEVKLDSNGFPKAAAFFDIDGMLGTFGQFHGEAVKLLFPKIEDKEELARVFMRGLHLGTTYRVFHRMIGIYEEGKEEWKDPDNYSKWLHENPERQKEVDGSGPIHERAARFSMLHSTEYARLAEEKYRENPQVFEQIKNKPVFHLAKLYQRLGIPMSIMTTNDEPFARSICKCLGLADSFIAMACQKNFPKQSKEGAIDFLINRLKEKGIPIPKNLIVVGDSLTGDIGSGARFARGQKEYSVKGVLITEESVRKAKERIENDSQLANMSVEVLNPEMVIIDKKGMSSLARYRREYSTK